MSFDLFELTQWVLLCSKEDILAFCCYYVADGVVIVFLDKTFQRFVTALAGVDRLK